MSRRFFVALAALSAVCLFAVPSFANQKLQSWVEQGNTTLTITGAAGTITRKVQGSFPSATITVYNAGTVVLATIYSDNLATPTVKANPFTAASDATWFFYASSGRYDVKFSGAGIGAPFTLGDFLLFDPVDPINVGNRVYCNLVTGATFGVKYTAAVALLPSTGGIVDCSNLQGAQSISSDVFTAVTKSITLVWPTGTVSSAVSLTVPVTTAINFPLGGILSMASATTATISSISIAGTLSQHFTGAGAFAVAGTVYPEWWGSQCNSSSYDDVTGIQGAVSAVGLGGGGVVRFQGGYTCTIKSLLASQYAVKISKNNIIVDGNGTIITDSLASSAGQALFGDDPAWLTYEGATGYNISANMPKGATSLTLTTPAQASNFAVGDAIYIRTGAVIDGVTNSEINQVKSANSGTGVITFTWPTTKDLNAGGNPFVVANVQAGTAYNTTIQNFTFQSHVLPMALDNRIGLTLKNITSSTLDSLVPGPPPLQSTHSRFILIDNLNVYMPHSCAASMWQTSVSLNVEIRGSTLVSNDVACTILNISDFSAGLDIHNNFFGGKGQLAGFYFQDLNLHDNQISINTGNATIPMDLEVGGTSNGGVKIHGNTMAFPGTSASIVLAGPQFEFTDNSVTSGSTARVLGIASSVTTGTGGIISHNNFTLSAAGTAIEIDGSMHDQVISSNSFVGVGTGTAIAVANTNASLMANSITGNSIYNFATGINIAGGLTVEPGVTVLANNIYTTTTPYTPSTANVTGQGVLWGTYTPTLTSVANIAASTAYLAQWMRVGNVVTVSGRLDLQATASAPTDTKIGISLPIASVFTAPNEAGGTGIANSSGGVNAVIAAQISADQLNARIQAEWAALDGNAHAFFYSYTYQIK